MKVGTVLVVLGVFSGGSVLGFLLGRDSSPDATKPETADIYLALYGRWKRIDQDHGQITLRAGTRTYSYTTGDPKVTVKALSASEMALSPMPKRNFDDDYEKIVTLAVADGGGAGIAATVLKFGEEMGFRKLHSPEGILVGVGAIVTGGLGYWIGHHTSPDVTAVQFNEELSKNVDLWKQFERNWAEVYSTVVMKMIVGEAKPCSSSDDFMTKMFKVHPEICEQALNDPSIPSLKSQWHRLHSNNISAP